MAKRKRLTSLGYRIYYSNSCGRQFNERTWTPFNDLQFPTDVVLLAVLWRLRYKLGFRDVAELLLERGCEVSYETVRVWEFRFAPLVSENLRAKRRGRTGRSWYLDETYINVCGRWRYLYRAIDRDGNLLDSMLSEHRDKHAARRFLRRLIDSAGR
ncbi:MAG: IS6 family transposase, partial [Chloroflexi bacterium]|nr:IS6 family transposase [Chloroflexota bacterium]